jgi:hypothetical protein
MKRREDPLARWTQTVLVEQMAYGGKYWYVDVFQ